MEELENELENLMDDFNQKISAMIGDPRNAEHFKSQYQDMARDYLRKIEYVLEDYGLDARGNSIEYLREIIMSQGERNSQKEASQHTAVIAKAVRMLNTRELEENKEIIENNSLSKEEKKESMNRGGKNKSNRILEFKQQILARNRESAMRVENYCQEAYKSLEAKMLKSMSSLDNREFQREYDSIKEKMAEARGTIRRLTDNFVEDYLSNLNGFDKLILRKVAGENERYSKQINQAVEKFEALKRKAEAELDEIEENKEENSDKENSNEENEIAEKSSEDSTKENVKIEDKEKKKLPENPFELSDDYKKKVVQVGKEPAKPKENDGPDKDKFESLDEDVIV